MLSGSLREHQHQVQTVLSLESRAENHGLNVQFPFVCLPFPQVPVLSFSSIQT